MPRGIPGSGKAAKKKSRTPTARKTTKTMKRGRKKK